MITHLLEAIRWASDQPCKPSNCGTVCLCGPCSARRSLAVLDPSYRPRHTKNFYFPVRVDRSVILKTGRRNNNKRKDMQCKH
jgi:hypothetical protein